MNRLACMGLSMALLAVSAMADDASRFSPAPHVWLSLPPGWIACDLKAGNKLAPGVDTAAVAAFDCKSTVPDNNTWTFGADIPVVFSGILLSHDPKIGHDFYEGYTPEGVRNIQARVCESLAGQLDETVRVCDVTVARRGNANALVGRMLTTSNANPELMLRVTFTMLAFEEWATQVVTVETAKPGPEPEVEALFHSISVE